MDKQEVCETLGINESQLSRLVKLKKIAVHNGIYDDFDFENLRWHSALDLDRPLSHPPSKAVRRSFRSDHITRLRFDLIAALKEAVVTSGLTRDEAQGQLCNLVSEIWESCEPVTWKLPG